MTDVLRPRPGVSGRPYSVPRAGAPVDLALDANEGAVPDLGWLDGIRLEQVRRYPDASGLEADLAAEHGVHPSQVIVTAGADDALDRACRAVLGPGDEAILPVPGFSVMSRWIGLTGATQVDVRWPNGAFPTDAVLDAITPRTRMIIVTSPNNPTGGVATARDLERLAAAAPGALLLVDLAYVEFADEDLTQPALAYPNALVMRTFSKAWGLAGLRVGYTLGSAEIIGWLRTAGLPYPCAGLAVHMARAARQHPEVLRDFAERVRIERPRLIAALSAGGARPQASQANFVLARVDDPLWWRDGLAGLGIGIRAFPGKTHLDDAIRIACPGSEVGMLRLERAIETLTRPERLLLEDGLSDPTGVGEVGDPAKLLADDARTSWVICSSEQAVRAAREVGALPIAVGDPDLVPVGAARCLPDVAALATLWPSEG